MYPRLQKKKKKRKDKYLFLKKKKLFPLCVENYYSDPQYEFGDQTEDTKNLS